MIFKQSGLTHKKLNETFTYECNQSISLNILSVLEIVALQIVVRHILVPCVSLSFVILNANNILYLMCIMLITTTIALLVYLVVC